MSTRNIQNEKETFQSRSCQSRNLWSGILIGLGLVAFIDEAVFHQLLHWHHFFDKSTLAIGLISDGLFHAFSWFSSIGGMFLLAELRTSNVWKPQRWVGGVLLGGGLFQLYDGIIQHKLMQLHQIRYVKHVFVYDLLWNVIAAAMIVLGVIFITRSMKGNR
ncbi:DUF2243 domain-containing protein [Paenibacillus nanensis]|uniref:DUF2243 domain-containing protein n=1 Tax=Paenibacillus nanensis TaxID=393251 RepID=A0A3A1US14_9BACL|nr:DUF2243 domain-containing protein [Paenibacillus nanensis]RIX50201.1 DUF2243 domain-containing protein [Paenibacillus nanensis]